MQGGKQREWSFEIIMGENFPELIKYTKPKIQEAQRILNTINTCTPNLMIFKLHKQKTMRTFWKREKSTSLLDEQEWELLQTSHQKPCKQKESGVKFWSIERKKMQPRVLCSTISIEKGRRNEGLLRKVKMDEILHEQNFSARSVKRQVLVRKAMT